MRRPFVAYGRRPYGSDLFFLAMRYRIKLYYFSVFVFKWSESAPEFIMSKKIFVGGLAWATTDDGLRAAFEPFGPVVEAKVIVERETGRSRGFGFVTFEEESAAAEAMNTMNGQTLEGRTIRVNSADDSKKKPSERPQRSYNKPRSPEVVIQRRDDNSPQPRHHYAEQEFSYPDDSSNQRRENRKKDKKKRERFEDDDRW